MFAATLIPDQCRRPLAPWWHFGESPGAFMIPWESLGAALGSQGATFGCVGESLDFLGAVSGDPITQSV